MLGTPYYMSPEQAQGIKAVDARSDLWSLAVIVFQALTGRLPFESEALGDLLVKIIVAPVPMPSQFAPDLPPTFNRWWEKASQRDPAGRFQSAREFGDALAVAFGRSNGLSGEGVGRPMAGEPGTGPYPAAPSPFGNTPNPMFGNTPQPPYGGTQPLQAMGPTTGASMSRTFDAPPSARPKSKAMAVAIGGASVVVLALAIVGATLALRSHEPPAASAAASPPPTATTALPTEPTATAPPPAPPPPAAVAVETPPATSTPAVTAPATASPGGKPGHAVAPPPKPPVAPAAPPPAPPATKKTRVDLGI
jgi:serine/threonine-protein kinase